MGDCEQSEELRRWTCCWLVENIFHLILSFIEIIFLITVRSMFERYEEKSYMKILKVEAVPTPTVNPPVEGFVWDNVSGNFNR